MAMQGLVFAAGTAAAAVEAWTRVPVVLMQSVLALQGNELYWQRNRSPCLKDGDRPVQKEHW